MPNGSRQFLTTCVRSLKARRVPLFGFGVLAWWIVPLIRPRGPYAECYRLLDLEIGVVATLIWAVCALVAAAPPARRRPLALRLTVALGALLITAVICDLAYVTWTVRARRFWYYGQDFPYDAHLNDPELVWKFRPGFAYEGRANPFSHKVRFQTDENGFRNPRGITQADVVFVGDSVTMAAEVPEEATFVQKTAQTLGLRTVNLGVFGYGPQQELAVLKRYGLAYEPRAVVWQVTEWNDCEDAERYAQRKQPTRPQLKPWVELYESYSPIVAGLEKIFKRKGASRENDLVLFQRSDGLVDKQYLWPVVDEVAKSPQGWQVTKRAIADAHALCRERGIALIVLFVPLHSRVLSSYVLPRTEAERTRFSDQASAPPSTLELALAEHCRALDCPFIDLLPALRQRATTCNMHLYIKHDPHLDLDGHDEAAKAVTACLRSQDATLVKSKEADLIRR